MRSPVGHAANAFSSFDSISVTSKSPVTATTTFAGLNTFFAKARMSSLAIPRIDASVACRASKWSAPNRSMRHSRARIGSASSLRCFMPSIAASTAIFVFASSNRGFVSMSMRSARLSSKFALSESIDAEHTVPVEPIAISVARKSSASSSSFGASASVPPVRRSEAVMPARPVLSAGSRYAPPRKVIDSSTSGSSLLGARNTTTPFDSSCLWSDALGGL